MIPDTLWILALVLLTPIALLGFGCATFLTVGHLRFVSYHRRHHLPVPVAAPRPLLAYWLRELTAILHLFAWRLRARVGATATPHSAPATACPVVCVHGYNGDSSNMWRIRHTLEACGRPTSAPRLGRPPRPLAAYAPALAAALTEAATDFPRADGIDVVAHSMGGLVLRLVLAERPDLAARIRRIVTLGTPHRGTAATLPILGAEAREMAELSPLIEQLPDFATLAPQACVTTVGAHQDYIVFPHATCHLPGCRRVFLDDVGHTGLLVDRRAIAVVRAALCDEEHP